MKVSFDFDLTLSEHKVQEYAKELVQRGFEVWIVTSRPEVYTGGYINFKPTNDDLFEVAEDIGIKREHIHFTNYAFKSEFIEGKNFIFHLDDDVDELLSILETKDNCKPLNVFHDDWKQNCEDVITDIR